MKKSMLLLSLFLVGNLAHAGIASKTLYGLRLLLPAGISEFGRIKGAIDVDNGTTDMRSIYRIFPTYTTDPRPFGEAKEHINPDFSTTNPTLYEAFKKRERARIDHRHAQQRTGVFLETAFLSYMGTSVLRRIKHPIATLGGILGNVALWMSVPYVSTRRQEHQLNAAITDTAQAQAFKTFLDEKESNLRTGQIPALADIFHYVYTDSAKKHLNQLEKMAQG